MGRRSKSPQRRRQTPRATPPTPSRAEAKSPSQPTARWWAWPTRHPLWTLLLVGLALRAVSAPWLMTHDNALFDPATFKNSDLWDNLRQAREVIAGWGKPADYFWHGPFYVYLVALPLIVPGAPFWSIYPIQSVLGAAAAVLVFLTADRLMGRRAAWCAGLGAALYAPSIYYESLMLCDAVVPFFMALLIWTAVKYQTEPRRRGWPLALAMGAILGALTLLRANLGLMGPALAVWLLIGPIQRRLRERLGAVAAIALVSFLMVLPVCLWNTHVVGQPRLTVGTHTTIIDFGWSTDSPGYFYYPEGELMSPSDPRVWKLVAVKARQFFAWFEFPDLPNFHLYKKLSPVLDRNPLTFRLLGPLALLGLGLGLGRWRKWSLLYVCFAVFLAAQILFYISGRYRSGGLVLLFPFAGYALTVWIDALGSIKRGAVRWRRVAGLFAATLALFVAVNAYDPSRLHSMWHSDSMFGNNLTGRFKKAFAEGDLETAELRARRILWIESPDYQIQGTYLLAHLMKARGRMDTAQRFFLAAQEMSAARQAEPPADGKGNRFSPPTH